MPFIQRVVEPVYLSRRNASSEEKDTSHLTDYELETVTNITLSNALRQLASLVLIANDIFEDLTKQLEDVRDRSTKLRTRLEIVEEHVVVFDPKKVPVPEGDICSFAARERHFAARQEASSAALFAAGTRPSAVRRLYYAAAPTPVPVMRQLDRYRRDGARCSRFFSCTPVLGAGGRRRRPRARVRDHDLSDIETSTPAIVAELRRWTSEEALGDITVAPDASRAPPAGALFVASGDEGDGGASDVEARASSPGAAHRLPSPEEQAAAVATRFPGEVVPVDTSGRVFLRMSLLRRSLGPGGEGAGLRRRAPGQAGRRKPRSRRRNTIAGTDQRELRRAVAGESQDETVDHPMSVSAFDDLAVSNTTPRDFLKSKEWSPSDNIKSHFNSLKQWGREKLKLIKNVASGDSDSKSSLASPEEVNIYEKVEAKGKKSDVHHERKPSGSSLPISTHSAAMSMAVKLRQRQARTGKDDAVHSSSGNWSASSESGRASVGSENTTTTHPPKSTTTLSSAATSSNSLNHNHPSSSVCSRRKFLNTSTSSSVSEGTLTPDIVSDLAVPFVDDGETSSIYSCDTEGYYTSFHLDSGLKTLKEEETNSTPQTPLHSTSALSTSPGRGSTLTAENEYELFGKGSTSTTTSSAGTVCTTLLVSNNESSLSLTRGPAVPERKSSLDQKTETDTISHTVVAMVHKNGACEPSESPDSGHNTSSSPVDSTSSPHGTLTGRSSECEFSESDLEGVDRLERIRVKTTINSSRIPSMCVITPPPSDDETSLNQYVPSFRNRTSVPSSNNKNRSSLLETDFGAQIVHSQKPVTSYQTANEIEHPSPARTLEKMGSTESEQSSDTETIKTLTGSPEAKSTKSSPKAVQNTTAPSHTDKEACAKGDAKVNKITNKEDVVHQKSILLPHFNNMLGKMRDALVSAAISKPHESSSNHSTKNDTPKDDSGDYVTISDVNSNNTNISPSSPIYSNAAKPTSTILLQNHEMEYVSLNELPVGRTTSPANILISPSNSLERKRRQGARVTLDSDGRVIYSSDSLRRNKGSHSTFEPGPYVKENPATPTASPLPAHRTPKPNIRPVSLSRGKNSPILTSKPTSPVPVSKHPASPVLSNSTSPTSPKLGKVIIRAGGRSNSLTRVASPTNTIIASGRPMSPPSLAGAYVNVQSPDDQRRQFFSARPQTTSSGPRCEEEGKPFGRDMETKLTSYLKQTNPILFSRVTECDNNAKVKRSNSYRMANSPPMQVRKVTNVEIAASAKNNPPNRDLGKGFETVCLKTNELDSLKGDKQICHGANQNIISLQKHDLSFKSDMWKEGSSQQPFGNDKNFIQNAGIPFKEETEKVVANPNAQGRRFYGAQVKVNPNIFAPLSPVGDSQHMKDSKETKDSERARVLKTSGKQLQRLPPQYVSPPPVKNNFQESYQHMLPDQRGVYWTLPAPHHDHRAQKVPLPNHANFNMISSTGGTFEQNRTHESGAYFSSQKGQIPVVRQDLRRDNGILQRQGRLPTPASVPVVPRNAYSNQNGGVHSSNLQSSTPTKEDKRHSFMEMSTVLSPISKGSSSMNEVPSHQPGYHIHPSGASQARQRSELNSQNTRMIHQPKSSMTAEELFAAIHKSKKKLNIKTDSDSCRSGSPSYSSNNSLSPVSSESSLNGLRSTSPKSENMAGFENVSRNRHSWSPNGQETYENHLSSSNYQASIALPGSRQSWACDRLGPLQQTSRNDFKRLLLQHGSSKSPNGSGGHGGRLSAVEQLRLSRQQRHYVPNNCPPPSSVVSPRSPADKRFGGPKLLPSPRSHAAWRFASPRTDVLSSTILEDCAEEERASSSPQENASQSAKLLSATDSSHGLTYYNATFRQYKGTNNETSTYSSKYGSRKVDSQNQSPTFSLKTNQQSYLSPNRRIDGQPSNPASNDGSVNSTNLYSEQLSPLNVKENVDTNQRSGENYNDPLHKLSSELNLTKTQLANYRARQLFLQTPNTAAQQHLKTTVPAQAQTQKTNFYNSLGSTPRSVLAAIETKTPSKATLETAL